MTPDQFESEVKTGEIRFSEDGNNKAFIKVLDEIDLRTDLILHQGATRRYEAEELAGTEVRQSVQHLDLI